MPRNILVETAPLMQKAQLALQRAQRTNDTKLRNAAESVMSALAVVMKHRRAELPAALAGNIALLEKR